MPTSGKGKKQNDAWMWQAGAAAVGVIAVAVTLWVFTSSTRPKPTAGPRPTATENQLRIGAWNIEWLGTAASRSGPAKNVAQKPEDVAAYIKACNVDVLALEEISDDDGLPTLTNTVLSQAFALLGRQTGQHWEYVLLPKKNATEETQLTGLAWNKNKVQMVGTPYKIPVVDDASNDYDEWARHPHAVKLSAGAGKTDLVLIPVHMKSNRGGDETRKQRALEAQALAATLDAVRTHFQDDDVVVLGDSNVLKKDEEAIAAYAAAGFVDLNSGDAPTTWQGPAPFDRIFVPAGEAEFAKCTLTVHAPSDPAAHKKFLSDHYLVSTTIEIVADEDADLTGPRPTPVAPAAPTDVAANDAGSPTTSAAASSRVETAPISSSPVQIAAAPVAMPEANSGSSPAPATEPSTPAPTAEPTNPTPGTPGTPENPSDPMKPKGGPVRIVSMLPNPRGGLEEEKQDEAITVKNVSDEAVDLKGWKVRDKTNRFWILDSLGTLAPKEEKTLKRAGQDMALDNDGDVIELLKPTRGEPEVIDRASYEETQTNKEIKFE